MECMIFGSPTVTSWQMDAICKAIINIMFSFTFAERERERERRERVRREREGERELCIEKTNERVT